MIRLLPLSLLAAVAVVAALAFAMEPAAAEGRYGKQKVVYHINYDGGDADRAYLAALGNIQNHINAVGKDNIDVKIVMHGDGVNLLKSALTNEKLQARLVALKGQNVHQAICNNTLTGRKIDLETDLFEAFQDEVVPSGVAELSYLQQQGYTYIKP